MRRESVLKKENKKKAPNDQKNTGTVYRSAPEFAGFA